MFDVICIGGASRDIFYKTSDGEVLNQKGLEMLAFPYGSKIIPEDVHFTYGGGAFNAANNFAGLGLKAALVANIGSKGTGSLIHHHLEEIGVSTKFLTRDPNEHTAMSFVLVDGKDHVLFTHRGANDHLRIDNWRHLKKASWYYISSITGKAHLLLPEIFNFAHFHRIKVAWNPGSFQLKEGYAKLADFLKQTEILILNKEEAGELVRSAKIEGDFDDEKFLAATLKSFGPKTVVVTCGSQGAYACDGFMEYFQKSVLAGHTVDTTGAGDAFGSTFTACQMMGLEISVSLEKAARNAAAVVGQWGAIAGLLSRKELFK